MMKHCTNPTNRGFALLLVMVYIFLSVVIITGVSTAVISSVHVTDTFDASRQALEAAEYGEVLSLMNFCEGKEATLGLSDWIQSSPTSAGAHKLPAFGEPSVTPLPMTTANGAVYIARTTLLETTIEQKPAEVVAEITDVSVATPLETPIQNSLIVVHAAGQCKNVTRCVEAIYRITSTEETVPSKQFTRISWRELPPSPATKNPAPETVHEQSEPEGENNADV